MSLRSVRTLGLALLLIVGISACAADQPRRVAPDTPLDQQCESVPEGARRLVLSGSDGVALGAAVLGPQTADVGVVIAYGASQTLCEWLGIASALASLPAQVLILDRRGRGSSDGPASIVKLPDDLLTALAWQQAHGVGKVAVLGSSAGTCGRIRPKGLRRDRSIPADPRRGRQRNGNRPGCTVEVLEIPGSDHSRQLVLRHPEVLEYIRTTVRSCA